MFNVLKLLVFNVDVDISVASNSDIVALVTLLLGDTMVVVNTSVVAEMFVTTEFVTDEFTIIVFCNCETPLEAIPPATYNEPAVVLVASIVDKTIVPPVGSIVNRLDPSVFSALKRILLIYIYIKKKLFVE